MRAKHSGLVVWGPWLVAAWVWPALAIAQTGAHGGQWLEHGGDKGATLYSGLDQIDEDNIGKLKVAWQWASIDAEVIEQNPDIKSIARIYHYEATPLMVKGTLYVSTSLGLVAALDPASGEILWRFDPETYGWGRPTNLGFLTRGVTYWSDGVNERLFHAPNDAFLISLDIKTGKPDPEFGDNGRIDLTQGLGVTVEDRRRFLRSYTLASPPIVCQDVVVVGSSIRDTPNFRELPPGHVRGFDARTGLRLWIFHTIPKPGEFGNETWENDSWKTEGSTNVWPPMSADEELGYVYLPVGTPSHNWYGGDRPGDNLFACSVVCLNAKTGKRIWHYQLIHHPLWDYDPPAAPNLIDITVGGRDIKAVAQLTKQGLLFTFDRATGEPVWPIEERPVPPSDLPGELASPTQPFPTKPAPFQPAGLAKEDLIDLTPELQAQALELSKDWRFGPIYTPPALDKPVMVNPGWSGGGNWNGAAFDPETHILYVPSYTNYSLVTLIEPDPNRSNFKYVWSGSEVPNVRGIPIYKPPYSRITAIDMDTGEQVWVATIGDGPRKHKALQGLDSPPLGRGLSDGEIFPLLTKTLLFATQDKNEAHPPLSPAYIRALSKRTGKVVWERELPGAVHATPMTYMYEGKQYVVVALGASLYTAEPHPDELIAFSL